jgi:apolipoprotein N-acyltransferase
VGRRKPAGLQYFNAALEFDPKGKSGPIYHKCHLVPFGEFMPFQKYLSFLGPIVSGLGNFTPGDHYLSLPAHGFTYSPTICYEAIFPGDMRRAAQTGADTLVNISNDAWYGHSAAAYQHAQMGIMRSAELHRPLLRAANTGISYISDPFGRVLAESGFFTQEALVGSVLTVDYPQTLYARWGNWLPESSLGATFLLLLIGLVKRPRPPMETPGPEQKGIPASPPASAGEGVS